MNGFLNQKLLNRFFPLKSIDQILENAEYSHSSEKTKNLELNAPSYEYYNYPIVINNVSFIAIVTVRVIKDGNDDRFIYYHHYLDNIYIKKEPPSSIPRNPETE